MNELEEKMREDVALWWFVEHEHLNIAGPKEPGNYVWCFRVRSIPASAVRKEDGTAVTKGGQPCYREEAFAVMAALHQQNERCVTTRNELREATHADNHAQRVRAELTVRLKELGVEL